MGSLAEERRDLEHRWHRIMGAVSLTATLRDDLLRRYIEPHRHYHTRTHLRWVLASVDALEKYCHDVTAVRLAVWFHDAVYDGRARTDEEASACLAEEALLDHSVAPRRVTEVARLVRLTATHDPGPADRDGQVLCDADLSILGASAEKYRTYVRDVRAEYAHVPPALFARGRAGILTALLQRPTLYHTRMARQWWQDSARRNITAELAELTDTAPPQPGRGEPDQQFPAG